MPSDLFINPFAEPVSEPTAITDTNPSPSPFEYPRPTNGPVAATGGQALQLKVFQLLAEIGGFRTHFINVETLTRGLSAPEVKRLEGDLVALQDVFDTWVSWIRKPRIVAKTSVPDSRPAPADWRIEADRARIVWRQWVPARRTRLRLRTNELMDQGVDYPQCEVLAYREIVYEKDVIR